MWEGSNWDKWGTSGARVGHEWGKSGTSGASGKFGILKQVLHNWGKCGATGASGRNRLVEPQSVKTSFIAPLIWDVLLGNCGGKLKTHHRASRTLIQTHGSVERNTSRAKDTWIRASVPHNRTWQNLLLVLTACQNKGL